MDTSKLITLEKRCQIISVIEKASPFGGDVWQTTLNGRQVLQIIQMHVDIKYDKLVIRTFGVLDINPEFPLFIRLSYRSLIFRLAPGQFKIMGDKIICHYPDEAIGLPTRNGERYILPFSSGISLSLKRNIRTMREVVFELEVRIMDVSQFGFGLLISSNNRDFLRRFDACWIKSVNHMALGAPLLGRVSYVAPKGYYLKKGEVRVGLSLDSALNEETFDLLKRKARVVLSA